MAKRRNPFRSLSVLNCRKACAIGFCWAVFFFKVFLHREFFVDKQLISLPYPKTLRRNVWQQHELDSGRLFCDLLTMMCCCCFQVRRSSSASHRKCLCLLQLVLYSLRFVLPLSGSALLSIFTVDKVISSVCVLLSCDCLVNFPCLLVFSSPSDR